MAVAIADRVLIELGSARWIYAGVMFGMNIIILLIALFLAGKSQSTVEREKFPPRPVAVPPAVESK
ncbi:MAG: hypothetical protein E4H33_03320 [Anaerolineales bacterium]|nr:MAG: hypothetical protein E4H33_03320 [Anaerolineales bacterium]